MPTVLALDEGTTSARALVFDQDGAIRGLAQKEFSQAFPSPGWVEHMPEEIWATQRDVAVEALARANVRPADLAAVGITNQRETTIVWDRASGQAISNAIVWQDRRTASWCDRLRSENCEPMIQERTGLLLDPYFSASKLVWILDNVPGARQKAEAGKLAFGTVDSWLVWKLTEGRKHLTDATNAAHAAVQHPHRAMGRRTPAPFPDSGEPAPRSAFVQRSIRRLQRARPGASPGCRHRRGPAGGSVRANVPGPRND